MTLDGHDALHAETTFLDGVAARFQAARSKPVPGRQFRTAHLTEGGQEIHMGCHQSG